MLSEGEMAYIKMYLKVYVVVFDATKMAEGDKYPTLSAYLPMIVTLKDYLSGNELQGAEKAMADELGRAISSRFEFVDSNDTLLIATAVDPRYKREHFSADQSKAAKELVANKMSDYRSAETVEASVERPPEPSTCKFIIVKISGVLKTVFNMVFW